MTPEHFKPAFVRGNPSDFPNPLKELRLSCGLTMEQVSRRTGVSKQFIIRSEQGVYTDPSDTLLEFYASEADFNLLEVKQKYYQFQRTTRLANYGRLIEPWVFPVGVVDTAEHPFKNWRLLSGISSAAGVCKLFCVHPATIDKFENRYYLISSVPEQLLAALLEAGYSPETLDRLESAYQEFKIHRREGFEVKLSDS